MLKYRCEGHCILLIDRYIGIVFDIGWIVQHEYRTVPQIPCYIASDIELYWTALCSLIMFKHELNTAIRCCPIELHVTSFSNSSMLCYKLFLCLYSKASVDIHLGAQSQSSSLSVAFVPLCAALKISTIYCLVPTEWNWSICQSFSAVLKSLVLSFSLLCCHSDTLGSHWHS